MKGPSKWIPAISPASARSASRAVEARNAPTGAVTSDATRVVVPWRRCSATAASASPGVSASKEWPPPPWQWRSTSPGRTRSSVGAGRTSAANVSAGPTAAIRPSRTCTTPSSRIASGRTTRPLTVTMPPVSHSGRRPPGTLRPRVDEHGVGADPDRGVGRQPVPFLRPRVRVGRREPAEQLRVGARIGVELQAPVARGGHADRVAVARLRAEVGDHHDVVVRPAELPAVERQHVRRLVHVEDPEPMAAQSPRVVLEVAPQLDEIAIEADDALEPVVLVPVQRDVVAEPPALEELLALEDHGDPGCGEDEA